jgi:hypothetical protein
VGCCCSCARDLQAWRNFAAEGCDYCKRTHQREPPEPSSSTTAVATGGNAESGAAGALATPGGAPITVWERWNDWNELVTCLQQDVVASQDMLNKTAGAAQSSQKRKIDLGTSLMQQKKVGGGKADEIADVIQQLRGYLEELPARPPRNLSDMPLPEDSSKLRRLPPAPTSSHVSRDDPDYGVQVQELVAAAQRSRWLSSVVHDNAHALMSCSSPLSFRAREVIIDTRNRRRGTVFLVLKGEVGLIFRSPKLALPSTTAASSASASRQAAGAAARSVLATLPEEAQRGGRGRRESLREACEVVEEGAGVQGMAAIAKSSGELGVQAVGVGTEKTLAKRGGDERSAGKAEVNGEGDEGSEGWAVAGVGALFGSTASGLEECITQETGALELGLNFHRTLKAWGKSEGRVR